jgi:hypothetical protein
MAVAQSPDLLYGVYATPMCQYGNFTGTGPIEAADPEGRCAARNGLATKANRFLGDATADTRAMLSSDSNKDYQQSFRVIGRFCTVSLFFACWAAVRHWPYPLYSLSNMLKVAFGVCIAFALLRNERFAGVNLNFWDEALAYIAIALFLDFLGAR